MAKTKESSKKSTVKTLETDQQAEPVPATDAPRPKLKKLEVSNFRAIGTKPVTIELDDIVVLVGSNNAGKSSILKAYQIVMSHGSADGSLTQADFPNEKIDSPNKPTIVLTTAVVEANSPGQQWIYLDSSNGEKLVTERWIWPKPGPPIRQGFDPNKNDWVDTVPWGAANVANFKRPKPYRVDAFDNPERQAAEIVSIITDSIEERLIAMKNTPSIEGGVTENDYQQLLRKISDLQKKVITDSQEQIKKIEDGISGILQSIFPNYVVRFDAKEESVDEKSISFFKSGGRLLMGPEDGFQGVVSQHGSGARRTLLWSALKFIHDAGLKKEKKSDNSISRPHILLIDEPELCLHPSAVRQACKVLYDLPKAGNWQVMVTTHSPIFIDLSRDNTTVVRVERSHLGDISSCTLFRPMRAKLSEVERAELKLLTLFDPYVAEFFFGGNVIVVEGDTEYAALKYVAEQENLSSSVQIIRARGKSTIVSLAKILNQFSAKYAILHDSDSPTLTLGGQSRANGAWTVNQSILNEVNSHSSRTSVRLLASLPNFEEAYLGSPGQKGDKPFSALMKIKKDDAAYSEIKELLFSLTDFDRPPPKRCIQWKDLNHLKSELEKLEV